MNTLKKLSKIISIVLLVLLAILSVYVLRTHKEIFTKKLTTSISPANVENKYTLITREIVPGGYVINDSMFYSPLLDLAFTGRLKSLKFRDGYFFEDRSYDGKSANAVTEKDILSWDYIKVFPKMSTELSPEEILSDLIRAEGKNPENCLINNYYSSEFESFPLNNFRNFYIHNKDTYKEKYPKEEFYKILTQREVYDILKKESRFVTDKIFPTYNEYRTYCKSGDNFLYCLGDYGDYKVALGMKDAGACSSYALNSRGGFFLFSDGTTGTYDENGGLLTTQRDEMPFFFIKTINTHDTSPWLSNAVTGIEDLLR